VKVLGPFSITYSARPGFAFGRVWMIGIVVFSLWRDWMERITFALDSWITSKI
jgi:hypothetical protein